MKNTQKIKRFYPLITQKVQKNMFFDVFFQIPPMISSKSHHISKNHLFFVLLVIIKKKDQKTMVRVLVLMFWSHFLITFFDYMFLITCFWLHVLITKVFKSLVPLRLPASHSATLQPFPLQEWSFDFIDFSTFRPLGGWSNWLILLNILNVFDFSTFRPVVRRSNWLILLSILIFFDFSIYWLEVKIIDFTYYIDFFDF